MPSVERPGRVSIWYEAHGAGSGPGLDAPPIVLAHGFGVSTGMWWPQIEPLSRSHWLILWDARGHGRSSAPREPEAYSMSLFAADLRAVLDDAGASDGAIIGGMSFGGQIALQFAVDYPEAARALIFSDSGPRGPVDPSEPPREVPIEYELDGLGGAFLAMAARPDLTSALPALRMPALVIYGEHDARLAEPVRRLAEGLPQRRVVCLAGCTHGRSAQRPDDWSTVVLRFLDDVEAGREISGEMMV